MNVLDDKQIAVKLKKLPANWFVSGDGNLSSQFSFDSVKQAKRFINEVVEISEKLKHHPNLEWQYHDVSVAISTHEAQGLTELDFKFAERVEKCLSKM